jgi:hypothetical protein
VPVWLISLLLNKYTLGALAGVALLGGAYVAGYQKASQRCDEATLRAQIASLQRDIAQNTAAADVAKLLSQNIQKENKLLQEKVKDYEVDLAKRPNPSCTIDKRDADRLRSIGGN